jgi:hypothetical protein
VDGNFDIVDVNWRVGDVDLMVRSDIFFYGSREWTGVLAI